MPEPRIQKAIICCQQTLGVDPGTDVVIEDAVLQDCINDTVEQLRHRRFNPIELSSEEIIQFRREMEFIFQIHQADAGVILDDIDDPNWYTDFINEPDTKTAIGQAQKAERAFFWERYRNYLLNTGFPLPVVNRLGNDTLNQLMNLLGNPRGEHNFFRKGLVVGDVQSGKTATYTGLICKAADAGYKVIILLTGTIEKLRTQTQKRLEEAFVGFDMTAQADGRPVQIGVGHSMYNIANVVHPNINTFTTRKEDFKYNAALQLNQNDVFFFVIKKNGAILRRLLRWLRGLNADHGKIHNSLLLIDDEADNASINTRKPEDDPTVINKQIRELADMFDQTTYVGFTATPFANVFINPAFDEEHMDQQDLFPSNFIFSLAAPDNYVGPTRIFNIFNDDGTMHTPPPEFHGALVPIVDAGSVDSDGFSFYHKHKREWNDNLPESLTEAIYCFFLANTLRDFRGDLHAPRTMMVNISRFVAVQRVIKSKLDTILTDSMNALQHNLNVDDSDDFSNEIICAIHDVWVSQYEGKIRFDCEDNNSAFICWKDVAPHLYNSNSSVQLRVINSQGQDTLDYDAYERTNHTGLRVIAIGGLALSRGLTLEGLMISYFYRNTATYDVLMQMGRWFGYRRRYEDIFRIWISPQSIRWYSEIADATEELKRDIRNMQEHDLKPKDFGIRVKRLSSDLSITAAMKMRTARMITEYLNFTGTLLETPYATSDPSVNRRNLGKACDFIRNIDLHERINGRLQRRNISREAIITFLKAIEVSPYNTKFPLKDLISFIGNSDGLQKWDVGIPEGNGPIFNQINGLDIKTVSRTIYISLEERSHIAIGRRGKLGGTADGKIGLDERGEDEEIVKNAQRLAREEFSRIHPDREWHENYSSDTWFRFIRNNQRKPLLMIYMVNPMEPDDAQEKNQNTAQAVRDFRPEDNPIVCFALGIPSDGTDAVRQVQYAANPVYTILQQKEMEADNADEEE